MNAEFASTATAVEEVAAGVARSAAEVVSDPVRSARRQVRAFERKGTPVVRRINRRLNALLPDRLKVFGLDVNGKLPEKVAIKGLQLVVGDIAKRTLRIFNGSFKTIARTATRLEQATQLTAHRESKPTARSARRRSSRRKAA